MSAGARTQAAAAAPRSDTVPGSGMREAGRQGLFVGSLADATALPTVVDTPITHVLSLCGLSSEAAEAIRQWQTRGELKKEENQGPAQGIHKAAPQKHGQATGRRGAPLSLFSRRRASVGPLRPQAGGQTSKGTLGVRRRGWAVHRRPPLCLKIRVRRGEKPEDSWQQGPRAIDRAIGRATDRAVQRRHLQVELLDMTSANLLDQLPRCLDFIVGALGGRQAASSSDASNLHEGNGMPGHRMGREPRNAVLVHCHAGVSRRYVDGEGKT